MSLIENALNKAGQEIREPAAIEGSPVHQSLKNILRLPSPSKDRQAKSIKVALIVLLSVVVLGGIAYVVVPKADHPPALSQAVEKQRTVIPAPSPAAPGDSDKARAHNDALPPSEAAPPEDIRPLPVMVVSPADEKIDDPSSTHKPEPTVTAVNTVVPAQTETSPKQNRTERDS